jgi:hypothetical protein
MDILWRNQTNNSGSHRRDISVIRNFPIFYTREKQLQIQGDCQTLEVTFLGQKQMAFDLLNPVFV